VTAVLLPPAWSAGLFPPPELQVLTAPGHPVTIALVPAAAVAVMLPAAVPLSPAAFLPPAQSAGVWLPALVVMTLPAPPAPPQPVWQRDAEGWAVARERLAHVQALSQYGELAIFALLWHIEDYQAGFVPRCYRCCQGDDDASAVQSAEAAIAAAYGQGNQYACPVCYNTTFALPEGSGPVPGLRALIVRPAIFTEFDAAQSRQAKGIFNSAQINVESTPDFRVRNTDYVFRADGNRFQLRVPHRVTLRTGFLTPWQASAAITYNLMAASLEDPLTIAYQIPPSAAQLAQILGTYTRVPADYSWIEAVNAPLIPEEAPSPASSGSPQPPATLPIPGVTL
jgi:hypothetical protein